MLTFFYCVLGLVCAVAAFFIVLRLIHWDNPVKIINEMDMPESHKEKAIQSMEWARTLNDKTTFFDLSAPFVVPFILLFTKWEAEKLAFWDDYYGNNVSINGDKFIWVADPITGVGKPLPMSLEDTPEARALAYWVDGKHHPRSFYARFVWLGLRNRAARYSQILGVDISKIDGDREYWGDPATARNHEGTVVFRCGSLYQVYQVKRVGKKYCRRINCGFKVWKSTHDTTSLVPPVNIYVSWIGWTGE